MTGILLACWYDCGSVHTAFFQVISGCRPPTRIEAYDMFFLPQKLKVRSFLQVEDTMATDYKVVE